MTQYAMRRWPWLLSGFAANLFRELLPNWGCIADRQAGFCTNRCPRELSTFSIRLTDLLIGLTSALETPALRLSRSALGIGTFHWITLTFVWDFSPTQPRGWSRRDLALYCSMPTSTTSLWLVLRFSIRVSPQAATSAFTISIPRNLNGAASGPRKNFSRPSQSL